MRKLQVLGSSIYLPTKKVSSRQLDQLHRFPEGTIEGKTGVRFRHYAQNETASQMAAEAIKQALKDANSDIQDIDCLIAASGTMEQAIPCNAANILAELKLPQAIAGFDVNATCLSALVALDLASSLLTCGQYKRIIIASSDIASPGLNWNHIESAGLFGDGAVAILVSEPPPASSKRVIQSLFKTYSSGLSLCQIRGGGSLHHPSKIQGNYTPYGLFEMQGKDLYRAASKFIQPFFNELLEKSGLTLEQIDWIIPHQASGAAMRLFLKKLRLDTGKVIDLLQDRGNQIAVSLPSGLHELLQSGNAGSGNKVLMIGTSAGLSLGGLILEI